jgi:hypothetical protein
MKKLYFSPDFIVDLADFMFECHPAERYGV